MRQDIIERLSDDTYAGALQHLRDWSDLDRLHADARDEILWLRAKLREVTGSRDYWCAEYRKVEATIDTIYDACVANGMIQETCPGCKQPNLCREGNRCWFTGEPLGGR